MYGGFYVLYDEMNESAEKEGMTGGKDDDEDFTRSRRSKTMMKGSGKQEWR
jgi:hypothetical protein